MNGQDLRYTDVSLTDGQSARWAGASNCVFSSGPVRRNSPPASPITSSSDAAVARLPILYRTTPIR